MARGGTLLAPDILNEAGIRREIFSIGDRGPARIAKKIEAIGSTPM
ncbi:MAG: hypothetical protein WA231_12620 [Methylocella sp.]